MCVAHTSRVVQPRLEPDPDEGHTANVVAALALALTDRLTTAVTRATSLPVSDLTALNALAHIVAAPSVEGLRRILGLTHSGTVRLVDRLAAAGLVDHGPGVDGRTSSVTLTAEGRAAAARVAEARRATVDGALRGLSDDDRVELDHLAGRVLVALVRGPDATRWICRLCDTGACGRYDDRCPIGREVTRGRDAVPPTGPPP